MLKLYQFQLIEYAADLDLPSLFLFPKIKKQLAVNKFSSNTEIIDAINEYFEGSYFFEGLCKVYDCVELNEDYVEK